MSAIQNKYGWKIASFAKGISADRAVAELERIESLYGSLTPESILEASRPKKAVFHSLFTWDDTKAAEQYRLSEARRILNNIEVEVISAGVTREISVFEVFKTKDGNQYRHVKQFSPDDIVYIKTRTLRELNYLKLKLAIYSQFSQSMVLFDQLIAEIEAIV